MAQAEVVPADHPGGKLATLHYHVLFISERGSWLEIALETGRTHQIRVQAASRGYPVLGDIQYGGHEPFGPRQEDERSRAIALHARSLVFRHPETQEEVDVVAPLPPAWDCLELPVEFY
jgi:23S rRNA pseudouridine1911/1915/1917 synthase